MTDEVSNITPLPAVASQAPVAVAPASPPAMPAAQAPQTPVATPAGGGTQLHARLAHGSSRLVGLLPHVQYQIARLGAVAVSGIAALVAAAVVAVSVLLPAQSALRSLNADIDRATHQPRARETPEEGLGHFVGTLPTRGQIPAVIGQILQQAQQAGVPLDTGHYAFSPGKASGVSRYELEFPVKASYPQVRDFINRTLTAIPAAGLDKLHIERKSVSDEMVNADVRFVVFVRGGE